MLGISHAALQRMRSLEINCQDEASRQEVDDPSYSPKTYWIENYKTNFSECPENTCRTEAQRSNS